MYLTILFSLQTEYFTERDDYEDEDDEEGYDRELDEINGLCSSSLEESGLGLLARFAASAIPSPVISGPMSLVQLEAKQKAKKKEERQSLLGEHMSPYCILYMAQMFSICHELALKDRECYSATLKPSNGVTVEDPLWLGILSVAK